MIQPVISVVAPVFNGEKTVREFIQRVWDVMQSIAAPFEILLVDDGSADESLDIMRAALHDYPGTRVIQLAGNFGQPNAIAAGLHSARGEFCVVMDSDLQDKPEDISALYQRILSSDVDMVIASRPHANMSLLRNLASIVFYKATNLLTTIRNPRCAGVFRILRRKRLQPLLDSPPQPGTVLSQLHARGCSWETMHLNREARDDHQSGYTCAKLLSLGLTRLIVFGKLPAKQAGGLGAGLSLFLLISGIRRRDHYRVMLAAPMLLIALCMCDNRFLSRFKPRYRIQNVYAGRPWQEK